jgi:DNA-binding CsgD family transcriptional regulator/tetratricopeptide (TPR) repeat protein
VNQPPLSGGITDTPTALDRGRAAYEDRRWGDAFEQLTESDRDSQLEPADLVRLATAASLIGRHSEGIDLLARAQAEYLRLGDIPSAALSAGWLAMRLGHVGEQARSSGWFARAQRLVQQNGGPCPAEGLLLVPAARAVLRDGDAGAAEKIFGQVTAFGERFADPDLTAMGQLGQGQARIVLGRTAEGLALLDEAMVAVTAGEISPLPSGIIYCAVIEGCDLAFDLHRAQEWTAALDHWCEAQPDMVPFSGQCQRHRGELFCLHGAWSDALVAAQKAEQRFLAGDRDAVYGAYYARGEVQRLRGEFDAAEQSYRQADQSGVEPQPGLALLRLAQGKPSAAQSLIRRALEDANASTRRRLLPASVEIELAMGDVAAARTAATALIRVARETSMPMAEAMASQAEGAVLLADGDPAGALTRLRRAWRIWHELDAPYEAARCRVLSGRACRELGDEDSALMEFEAARAVFLDLGARPAVDAVSSLSGQHRSESDHALTPRELEVLRLVAAGKSNRVIAAELYLSEKTIARHVSNIFTKLDLSSRSAATAYAYQNGLV